MADQKVTQLTQLTDPASSDILYIVDDPGGSPVSKKIEVSDLFTAIETIFLITAPSFIGDQDAQLVGGDGPALHSIFHGRPVLLFDDTDEEAALTPELIMPATYGGGTLVCDIHFFMVSDNTNDIAMDVFMEAVTPDSDTLDMETAASWDSANSGTVSLSGSTAGDALTLSITLSNDDSVAVGDLIRFGIRRDCDSVNDDASGDLAVMNIRIRET